MWNHIFKSVWKMKMWFFMLIKFGKDILIRKFDIVNIKGDMNRNTKPGN